MRGEILVGMVVGVLLVSFASAGLIDYFGMITGEVEVERPVFYLDKKLPDSDVYYSLKLNEESDTTSIPTLDGDENLWFVSEILGIDNFYDEKYNVILEMKSVDGNLSLTGSISAELWIGDDDNHRVEKICGTSILLGIGRDDYATYNLDCIPEEDDDGLKNIDEDEKIMLSLITDPSDIGINIKIRSSEIEVLVR